MAYFKFLQSKYIPDMLEGRLQLCSLEYYRLLESLSGNDFIGDLNDGLRAYAMEDGILTDGDSTVICHSNTVTVSADGYAFCFAEGDFGPLQAAFSEDRPGLQGYSGCIEIHDIAVLSECIANALCLDGIWAGKRVSDIGAVTCKNADYNDDRPIVPLGAPELLVPSKNAYLKETKYRQQQEWRVVASTDRQAAECFRVQAAIPDGLFTVRASGTDPQQEAAESVDSAIVQIIAIMEEVMANRPVPSDHNLTPGGWRRSIELDRVATDRWLTDFSRYKKPRLAALYWTTRSIHPSSQVDRYLTRSNAPMMVTAFDDYAYELSQN